MLLFYRNGADYTERLLHYTRVRRLSGVHKVKVTIFTLRFFVWIPSLQPVRLRSELCLTLLTYGREPSNNFKNTYHDLSANRRIHRRLNPRIENCCRRHVRPRHQIQRR